MTNNASDYQNLLNRNNHIVNIWSELPACSTGSKPGGTCRNNFLPNLLSNGSRVAYTAKNFNLPISEAIEDLQKAYSSYKEPQQQSNPLNANSMSVNPFYLNQQMSSMRLNNSQFNQKNLTSSSINPLYSLNQQQLMSFGLQNKLNNQIYKPAIGNGMINQYQPSQQQFDNNNPLEQQSKKRKIFDITNPNNLSQRPSYETKRKHYDEDYIYPSYKGDYNSYNAFDQYSEIPSFLDSEYLEDIPIVKEYNSPRYSSSAQKPTINNDLNDDIIDYYDFRLGKLSQEKPQNFSDRLQNFADSSTKKRLEFARGGRVSNCTVKSLLDLLSRSQRQNSSQQLTRNNLLRRPKVKQSMPSLSDILRYGIPAKRKSNQTEIKQRKAINFAAEIQKWEELLRIMQRDMQHR